VLDCHWDLVRGDNNFNDDWFKFTSAPASLGTKPIA
jgi:hypothetical protein